MVAFPYNKISHSFKKWKNIKKINILFKDIKYDKSYNKNQRIINVNLRNEIISD